MKINVKPGQDLSIGPLGLVAFTGLKFWEFPRKSNKNGAEKRLSLEVSNL